MKVTPMNRRFGKYQPGDVFDLPDRAAKVLIKVGKLQAVTASMGYETRMLTAASVATPSEMRERFEMPAKEEAPYGYKADGTPKKRPGRQAKAE